MQLRALFSIAIKTFYLYIFRYKQYFLDKFACLAIFFSTVEFKFMDGFVPIVLQNLNSRFSDMSSNLDSGLNIDNQLKEIL